MKPVTSRMKLAVRTHGLDWITSALAATAVALFILAMARAAGAAHEESANGGGEYNADRCGQMEAAQTQFVRRLDQVVDDCSRAPRRCY